MKKIIYLFISLLFLMSCTTMEDAGKVLRNEKIKTTDEFLVKKKEPLILPPDYDKIPEPGSIKSKQKSEDDEIRKILKNSQKKSNEIKSSISIEDSIIDKIRK